MTRLPSSLRRTPDRRDGAVARELERTRPRADAQFDAELRPALDRDRLRRSRPRGLRLVVAALLVGAVVLLVAALVVAAH